MPDLSVLIIIAQFLLKDILYDKFVKDKEMKLVEKYAQTYLLLNESLKEAIKSVNNTCGKMSKDQINKTEESKK